MEHSVNPQSQQSVAVCRDSSLDDRARQQSLNTSMQRFAHHGLRQAYNTVCNIICLTKPMMDETLH